jgi:hypothetical protein
MTRAIGIRIALAGALALGAVACRDEGPAEKAGRKFDDAIDKLRHGDEGALEKAGREAGEALEEAGEDAEEAIEDLREKTADAIEGD